MKSARTRSSRSSRSISSTSNAPASKRDIKVEPLVESGDTGDNGRMCAFSETSDGPLPVRWKAAAVSVGCTTCKGEIERWELQPLETRERKCHTRCVSSTGPNTRLWEQQARGSPRSCRRVSTVSSSLWCTLLRCCSWSLNAPWQGNARFHRAGLQSQDAACLGEVFAAHGVYCNQCSTLPEQINHAKEARKG